MRGAWVVGRLRIKIAYRVKNSANFTTKGSVRRALMPFECLPRQSLTLPRSIFSCATPKVVNRSHGGYMGGRAVVHKNSIPLEEQRQFHVKWAYSTRLDASRMPASSIVYSTSQKFELRVRKHRQMVTWEGTGD